MNQQNMIYPLFTMAMLTGGIMFLLFCFRIKAVRDGKVEPDYLEKQGVNSAPPLVVMLNHNLANLFEFPVLFMIVGVLLITLNMVDEQYLLLAWSYVALRYIHSAIHITYNRVLHRASVHFLGDMILIVIWCRLLLQSLGVI